jgi:proline iminopeptidase
VDDFVLFHTWEGRLFVDPESIARGEDPKFAFAFARIENHYFINKGFLKSGNQLIDNPHILKDIPEVIVQGRYVPVDNFEERYEKEN